MKKIVLVFICLFSIGTSFSQILFSEDFNYPTGVAGDSIGGGLGTTTALGDTIWKKHSGNALNGRCIKYVTSSLSLAGYSGSGIGGAASLQHTVGAADINGYLGQSINSGSVYTSFLLRVDSTTGSTSVCDYGIHYADLYGAVSIANFRDRLFICAGSDSLTKFKIGISKGTNATLSAAQITAGAKAPVFAASEYNIGQTYLCVLKYKFNSVSTRDDEISLTIFSAATLPNTEPAADVSLTDTAISDLTKIQSICLRQGSIGKVMATVDGIRVFTTWDAATIAQLPVRLLSFNASKTDDNKAKVWWVVAGEVDMLNYVVEKSTNGKEFNLFATVAAKGNTNYEAIDNVTLTTTTYYRVKFVNKNGTFTYSNTVAVTPKKSVKLEVFPNPVQNNLIVSYPKTNTNANIRITGIDGKIMMNIEVKAGNTQTSFDISTLKTGSYIVVFNDAEGNKTTKTIIKN